MLSQKFSDWTDADLAMHELAIELELVPKNASFPSCKHLYWGGKYYEDLNIILQRLQKIGILEFNEIDNQYRANQNFQQLY